MLGTCWSSADGATTTRPCSRSSAAGRPRPASSRSTCGRSTDAFDAATAAGPTSFFFASDITPAARPVAVDGTAAMVERGEHREAVFWLVATFARCLQILDATAAPDRERHHRAFAAAVADLLGLRTPADLVERRAGLRATLPQLRRLGQEIAATS